MKSRQKMINDLNVEIEELKKNVTSKHEELTETKQQLQETYKQIDDMTNHIATLGQKNKDQISKNTGNIFISVSHYIFQFCICGIFIVSFLRTKLY